MSKKKKNENIKSNKSNNELDNEQQFDENVTEESSKDNEDKLSESILEKDLEDDEKNNNENLSQEIASLKEEKIRILAEMENLRKRFEKEKIETIKYGSMNLAREILSPGDNLSRALESISDNHVNSESLKNLIDGLKMVQKEFATILQKNGINKIESLNQKFDHNFHQAMMEVEKDDVEEGIVVQEVQAGYTMYDRLLRPAMVGVSKKKIKKGQ